MQQALTKGRATLNMLCYLFVSIPIDLVLYQTHAGMLPNVGYDFFHRQRSLSLYERTLLVVVMKHLTKL